MNGRVAVIFKFLVVLSCINTACAGVWICPYYDNRKCAVIWTGDDLMELRTSFYAQAVKAAESNKIVFTAGVITTDLSSNGWNEVQRWYTNGAFSIASHSVFHVYLSPWVSAQNVEYEVAASQSKIIQGLDLPAWNKYKGRQFITAWIQPSGVAPEPQQSEFRRQLGANYYLSDRKTGIGVAVSWDSTNGLFSRIGSSGIDIQTLAQNNSAFSQCYNLGQVYLFYGHPWINPITNGSAQEAHMKYIGGRKDVWYSGFEYVYTYKYLQSVNPPGLTISTSDTQRVVFESVADSVARSKYGLSYPLTYGVNIPTSWTGVYVFCSDAGNPTPQRMTGKTTNDFFNGLNVFRQDTVQHIVYVSQAFPEYHDAIQVMILDVNGDADGDGILNRNEENGLDMLTP